MLCNTNDGMGFYMACNVMPKLSKMLVAIKSFENLDLHHGKQVMY
jgi:spore maturation protein SpmB